MIWKPKPHLEQHPDVVAYRERIRQAIEELYSGNFTVPVVAEFEFHMATGHQVNVSGMQYMVSSALCPVAVSHVGLIEECHTTLHYKTNAPKTVITLRPKMNNGQQTL